MRTYDAVVVGSGFGGAVAACRLSERGRSVLVLERGRRWGREDFPRPGQPDAPWRFEASPQPLPEAQSSKSGLFEIRRFPGMTVVVAAGVGGGSLVYTNVQKIPPASAFAGWPAFAEATAGRPAPNWLEYLRPYYQRVREMLEPSPLPHDLQRLRAFEAAHAALGRSAGVERPPLAVLWPAHRSPEGVGEGEGEEERINRFGAPQQSCNLCGQCVLGCGRHAKNTLDLNYLKRAESLGAEVRPLCRVTRIEPHSGGYEVSFHPLPASLPPERQGEERVAARAVFLAAGSLGTTELLLRCRNLDKTLSDLSPRLGERWSANGDFFAGLLDSRIPIAPTEGPSVAAGYEAPEGFYTLEGAIPSSLVAGRRSLVAVATRVISLLGLSFLRERGAATERSASCGDGEAEESLRRLGVFFLMGRDASDGRLRLDARGALDLDWDPRASELLLDRMRRYLRELGRGYGGWMIVPERWWTRGLATVHPLGGCAMGRDPSEGVCDPFGRVFSYENLFICDGSLFPCALGFPPSLTIAALAEHVVEKAVTGD